MIKKEWGKPRVKELDVLMTEFSFDNLLSDTAVGLLLLLKDDGKSGHKHTTNLIS